MTRLSLLFCYVSLMMAVASPLPQLSSGRFGVERDAASNTTKGGAWQTGNSTGRSSRAKSPATSSPVKVLATKATGAATSGATATSANSTAGATTAPSTSGGPANSSADFQALYKAAQAEGGKLTVKFGGDETFQQDVVIARFKAAFPAIDVTHTVDLSKVHDVNINDDLSSTGKAGCDIAILQTLQDFDKWQAAGNLLPYKPIGFEKIRKDDKDADGNWYGVFYITFGPVASAAAFPQITSAPIEFEQFQDPALKNKLVLTYPNDDDAVLFQFHTLEQQFGEEAVKNFMTTMDIQWVRGTATPTELFNDGERIASFTSGAVPTSNIPSTTKSLVWAQTGAIFKTAENPETAKLFMSYLLSAENQAASGRWPVRTDLPNPSSLDPLETYQSLDPTAFRAFMRDQDTVNAYRTKIDGIIGKPVGGSPLTDNIGINGTIKG